MRIIQSTALLVAGAACALGGAALSGGNGADAASSNQKVYNALLATARNTSTIKTQVTRIHEDLNGADAVLQRLKRIDEALNGTRGVTDSLNAMREIDHGQTVRMLEKVCDAASGPGPNSCLP